MAYFVGMDVSKKSTAVCVMDADGAVVARAEVETTPLALVAFLRGRGWRYRRIGMEAGDMASWLYAGLIKAKLPVLQIDPRHAHSVLSAQRHKTDRNDAQGIAELMRVGAYKGVHTRSRESQDQRALLVARRTLMVKRVDLDTVIRALLRSLGLKLPRYINQSFAARVRALGESSHARWIAVEPLLLARDAIVEQIKVLERQINTAAQADPVCRRLMTVPGVGKQTALAFRSSVDDPRRFVRSRSVAVHFGLTPRVRQSGETVRKGRISKWGDGMVRSLLFMAASHIRASEESALHRWSASLRKRMRPGKVVVAVARKIAVILHRMWLDGTDFNATPGAHTTAAE
ncbi:IS110 family transposase [Caulobacter sp. KR2-114]|uniref:IS110 family transposase n=1 Tax=Caulobacter sp. KR2-114 TaxID=3400912 RepID=UPI003C067537